MNDNQLKRVLNTLNDESDSIKILYWFCYGFNEKEIAFKVEPKEATIRSLLHRMSAKMESFYVLEGREPSAAVDAKYPYITHDVVRFVINELGQENPDWSKFPFELDIEAPPIVEEETTPSSTTIPSDSEPPPGGEEIIPSSTATPTDEEGMRRLFQVDRRIVDAVTPQRVGIAVLVLFLLLGAWRIIQFAAWDCNPFSAAINCPFGEAAAIVATEETPVAEVSEADPSPTPAPVLDETSAQEMIETAVNGTQTAVAIMAADEMATQAAISLETEQTVTAEVATLAFAVTATSTETPTHTPSPTVTNTPTQIPTPSAENLVVHHTFDGIAGSALVLGATLTEGRHGLPNTAYSFNGVSSIVIPDAIELRGDMFPLTVAVWFNALRVSDVEPLVVKYLSDSSKDWGLFILNGKIGFGSENGSSIHADYNCLQSIGSVTKNEWHLALFVADDPHLTLYLDGEAVGSCSDLTGKWMATDANVEIGIVGYSQNQFAFIGTIDDVWIWNRTLSPEEILNLYNFTK